MREKDTLAVHQVEASSLSLVTSLSVTDDDNSNVAAVSLLPM